MNGAKAWAASLLALVAVGIGAHGDVAGASVRSSESMKPCSVVVAPGPDAGLCTVPDPGAGDTLPAGYDSGVRVSVTGVQYGPDPAELLDLYLPTSTTPAPVIVFFHGGGWIGGSRALVAQSLLREVLDGYAVVSVDYRLAPIVQFPVPLQDAKTAIRWVKAHAAQYRLRADEVFAAGASAGGHIAAMVAMTPGLFEPTDLTPQLAAQDSRVVGAVLEVGPLNLNALSLEGDTWGPALVAEFLGCPEPSAAQPVTCSEEQMAAASPISYVTRDDPPIYLAYGSQDTLVPPATNAFELAHEFTQLGNGRSAAVDEVQNLGHNLDIDGLNITRLHAFLDRVRDGSHARVTLGSAKAVVLRK